MKIYNNINRKRKLFLSICNRHKKKKISTSLLALLCLWIALNILLFIIGFRSSNLENTFKYFYPFNYNVREDSLWAYDISELLVYTFILPIVTYHILKFTFYNVNGKSRKRIMCYVWTFIAYCLGFAIVSIINDSEINKSYLILSKAIIMFYFAYYIGGVLYDCISEFVKKKT